MEHFKYALDVAFMFMLFVTIALFGLHLTVGVSPVFFHTVEFIDYGVIAGYYFFFIHGIINARSKLKYVKQHMFLVILLVLPFIPLARFFRLHHAEHVLKIGADSMWHLLDRIGML